MTNKQELINNYLSFAKKIAYKHPRPSHISLDEIQSAAFMGLCEAAHSYKSGPFHPYLRIKGAIIDYLRSCGWGSRNHRHGIISLDDENFNFDACFSCQTDYLENLSQKEELNIALSRLSEVEKKALILYNVKEESLQQVADQVDMSVSGVWKLLQRIKDAA